MPNHRHSNLLSSCEPYLMQLVTVQSLNEHGYWQSVTKYTCCWQCQWRSQEVFAWYVDNAFLDDSDADMIVCWTILPLHIFIPPTYHTKIKLWYPDKQTHWMLRSTGFELMYKWIWLDERLRKYSSLKQVRSNLQCSTPGFQVHTSHALLVSRCILLMHCWRRKG